MLLHFAILVAAKPVFQAILANKGWDKHQSLWHSRLLQSIENKVRLKVNKNTWEWAAFLTASVSFLDDRQKV